MDKVQKSSNTISALFTWFLPYNLHGRCIKSVKFISSNCEVLVWSCIYEYVREAWAENHSGEHTLWAYREHEQVLRVVTMKSTIILDVIPCSLVEVQHSGGLYYLHLQGWRVSQASNQQEAGSKQRDFGGYLLCFLLDPEGRSSMFLWNKGKLPLDYMFLHTRGQYSSITGFFSLLSDTWNPVCSKGQMLNCLVTIKFRIWNENVTSSLLRNICHGSALW
jgi:hypothetical protein